MSTFSRNLASNTPDPNDDPDYAAIRERLRKASAGDWKWHHQRKSLMGLLKHPHAIMILSCVQDEYGDLRPSEEDADFIAHAPTDIQHLLNIVEVQAATIAALTSQRDDLQRELSDTRRTLDLREGQIETLWLAIATDASLRDELNAENERLKKALAILQPKDGE